MWFTQTKIQKTEKKIGKSDDKFDFFLQIFVMCAYAPSVWFNRSFNGRAGFYEQAEYSNTAHSR